MSKLSKLQLRLQAENKKKEYLTGFLMMHKNLFVCPKRLQTRVLESDDSKGLASILPLFRHQKFLPVARLLLENTENKPLQALIKGLIRKKADKLLAYPELLNALPAIAQHEAYYIRNLEAWKPKSHNAYKLLHELIGYLFAKYPTPTFLESAFYLQEVDWIQWYIRLAQGESPYQCISPPFEWTRKMAHSFMQAPAYFTIPQALRYAQVMGLTKNENLAYAIAYTHLGNVFQHEEFWLSLIYSLACFTHLAFDFVNRLFLAIKELKFGTLAFPAVYPDLQIQNRDLGNLGGLITEWEKIKAEGIQWKGLPIQDFEYRYITEKYSIQQIFSAQQLKIEGKLMAHCAGSYANDIANRHSRYLQGRS